MFLVLLVPRVSDLSCVYVPAFILKRRTDQPMFVVIGSVSVHLSYHFQRKCEVNPPTSAQYSVIYLYHGN